MASKRPGLTGTKAAIADARRRLTVARKKLATQTLDAATRRELELLVERNVAFLEKTFNGEAR